MHTLLEPIADVLDERHPNLAERVRAGDFDPPPAGAHQYPILTLETALLALGEPELADQAIRLNSEGPYAHPAGIAPR